MTDRHRKLPARALAASILVLVACGQSQAQRPQPTDEAVREKLGEVPARVDTQAANALSAAFRAAAAQALPAVVSIQVRREARAGARGIPEQFRFFFEGPEGPNGPQEPIPDLGGGSGFILDTNGHVVTNHHVVEGAEDVLVRLPDGREFTAEVVGSDASSDVAVIKIAPDDGGITPARLGNSEPLQVGDWVLALGSPLQLEFTVTAGIVSAKGRQITGREAALESFIQTDAAINPGNSGGPLIDLEGRVVGINTAILGPSFVGYGFAIPVDLARRVIDDLLEYGYVRRPQLGVRISSVTAADAEVYGLGAVRGAEVAFVNEGSPADDAGLEVGDVIVALEGDSLRDSTELIAKLAQFKPGDEVDLTIVRDGKQQNVPVELGEFERPDGEQPQRESREQVERTLGFRVRPLDPQSAQQLGFADASGIVVANVSPFSPAANAGIQPGQRVLAINRQPVRSLDDVREIVEGIEPGAVVSVRVEVPELGETIINYRTRR